MHKPTRKTAIVLGTVLLVSVGGAAYAYWTSTGSGTGTAQSGNTLAVVVNQTTTVTGLAPGLPAQSLAGNFTNPNAGPVYVTTVTATVTGTDKTGCGPTDYLIAGAAGVGAQVPSGTGGAWTGLTIQFNNKGTNQDACKDALVTIAYASN